MAITLNDLQPLREAAEVKRKELDELENAIRVLERIISGELNTDVNSEKAKKAQPRMAFEDRVNEIIQAFKGREFSVEDVELEFKLKGQEIIGQSPRARIAGAMSKLVRNGKVYRSFEGRGSIPHRFLLKTDTNDESQSGPTHWFSFPNA